MFSEYDMERIAQEFHPLDIFHTGACNPGIVVKFVDGYLKIYYGSGTNYNVQIWRYGKQMPELTEEVDCRYIMPWLHKMICTRNKPTLMEMKQWKEHHNGIPM